MLAWPGCSSGRHLTHPALASTLVLPQPQTPLCQTQPTLALGWQHSAGRGTELATLRRGCATTSGCPAPHTQQGPLQGRAGQAALSPGAPANTGAADVAPPAAAAEPGPAVVPSAAVSSCNTCVRVIAGMKSVGLRYLSPRILLQGATCPCTGGSCLQKNLPN